MLDLFHLEAIDSMRLFRKQKYAWTMTKAMKTIKVFAFIWKTNYSVGWFYNYALWEYQICSFVYFELFILSKILQNLLFILSLI